MAAEEYSIGYEEGYQDGWNAALEPTKNPKPVAWVCEGFGKEKHNLDYEQEDVDALEIGTMLYTSPIPKEFGELLMKLHEKYKHQHNHFHVEAVNFWEKKNGV
jgi:hypothetical protein